jgi:hypothetical protein
MGNAGGTFRSSLEEFQAGVHIIAARFQSFVLHGRRNMPLALKIPRWQGVLRDVYNNHRRALKFLPFSRRLEIGEENRNGSW